MKQKFIDAYVDVAERFAQLSSAERLQVGAIVVKDNRIISIGYNGMPSGWTNECEHKEYMPVDAAGWLGVEEIEEQWPFTEEYEVDDGEFVKGPDHVDKPGIYNPGKWTLNGKKRIQTRRYRLKSKSEVLHAESNCIAKLARSSESGEGASIFITHAPCIECAKLIYQSGIATVYYKSDYRSTQGIDFLVKSNIEVVKV